MNFYHKFHLYGFPKLSHSLINPQCPSSYLFLHLHLYSNISSFYTAFTVFSNMPPSCPKSPAQYHQSVLMADSGKLTEQCSLTYNVTVFLKLVFHSTIWKADLPRFMWHLKIQLAGTMHNAQPSPGLPGVLQLCFGSWHPNFKLDEVTGLLLNVLHELRGSCVTSAHIYWRHICMGKALHGLCAQTGDNNLCLLVPIAL